MKFCANCGRGLEDNAAVCYNCNSVLDYNNTMSDEKLRQLSDRIKTNGIIWLIVGIVQLCTGVFCIVGILNIISAIKDIKWSKEVITRRVGLVRAYTPMTSAIITLIYNAIFGGVIGIVGSIYYFVGIRGYIMDNKDYFNKLT